MLIDDKLPCIPKYSLPRLRDEISCGKQHDFIFFWGHRPSGNGKITKSCMSQWWQGEFQVSAHTYHCAEQYMMAEKARLFNDEIALNAILTSAYEPKLIKNLGRQVKGFQEELWDSAKYSIVVNGNYCKFMQNTALKDYLLSTGDAVLVEASPYDIIWGIGMTADDKHAQNPLKWKGQNLLGFALMDVRDELARI